MFSMMNSSQVSSFTLSAYFNVGLLRYFFFMIILCLYLLVVGVNVLLVVTICVNRSLHEPMYLFLCSLFLNEVYGSSGLFPFLLLQVLSDVHTVPAPLCFLQIFVVYSYGSVEFFTLAVMSYDRYVAICCPLRYNSRVTRTRVAAAIFLTWFLVLLLNVCTLSLIVPLQLCGNVVHKVYCDYHAVVKLACDDDTVNNVYGLVLSSISVFSPLALILFTYVRILQVCFSGSRQTRQKALSTCSPHLASLLNFTFGASFEILQSRFDMSGAPDMWRIFLSLYFLACPPLFNPLMYGLKLTKIRAFCKGVLSPGG